MKPEYIEVSKNDSFLSMLTDRLSYLESAEVFISNDLIIQQIKHCKEVLYDNVDGTYILVWRNFDLPYKQSISIYIDSKLKWQKISKINICNKTFVLNTDRPKYKLYFLNK